VPQASVVSYQMYRCGHATLHARTKLLQSNLQPTVMQMPPLLPAERTMCTDCHGCCPTLDSNCCACEIWLHAKLTSMKSSMRRAYYASTQAPGLATRSLDRPANTGSFCSFSSRAVRSKKPGTIPELRCCDAVHAASGALSMQLALTEDDLAHICESDTLRQRHLSHTCGEAHTEMLRRNWYQCRCAALCPAV
jgi:hypothetical protein